MFGIRLDRFDHQIDFIGAVDLARYAVVGAWLHGVGFGEVMQPINAASGMVEHHEDRARTVFRPRKQREVIGAEVEHEGDGERGSAGSAPASSAAPLRGSPAGLLRSGLSHRAAPEKNQPAQAEAGGWAF